MNATVPKAVAKTKSGKIRLERDSCPVRDTGAVQQDTGSWPGDLAL